MVPPPLYKDGSWQVQQNVVNYWFPFDIREIANEIGLEKDSVIDIFEALGGT